MGAFRVPALGLAYLLLALALLWPSWQTGELVGHPGVDVYNHAWGLWWWADSLSRGQLPWQTDLLFHPKGGVLFHIDPVGAVLALPVTLAGGGTVAAVALAWNLVALLRVALAGLAAHLLCEELTRPGLHGLVAGVAHATTPFLLAEQLNGITEVTSTGFVALALWGWARAWRSRRLPCYALAGLLTGLASACSFYLGLAVVLPVAVVLLVDLVRAPRSLAGLLLGAAGTAAIALPVFAVFRASFASPLAILPRGGDQNLALVVKNAVDPRELVVPGFASFDYAAVGELFTHSLYLRLGALLLAAVALWRHRELRWPWAMIVPLSVVLALGPYLAWDGALVRVGPGVVGLPFLLLQQAVPELAITHAARLGVTGLAVLCALAGAAVQDRRWLALPAAALLAAEGLWASPAKVPLPTAPADVPAAIVAMAPTDPADRRGLLDLPPQVDRSMYASRHLWYQVGHHRPIPYGPDPHISRSGDNDVLLSMERHTRGEATTDTMSHAQLAAVLPGRYAWVVVHDDLEALAGGYRPGTGGPYARLLGEILGPPTVHEGPVRAWLLSR